VIYFRICNKNFSILKKRFIIQLNVTFKGPVRDLGKIQLDLVLNRLQFERSMTHLNAWNHTKIDFEFEFWLFFHTNRTVFLKQYIVELNELLHRVQRSKKHTIYIYIYIL